MYGALLQVYMYKTLGHIHVCLMFASILTLLHNFMLSLRHDMCICPYGKPRKSKADLVVDKKGVFQASLKLLEILVEDALGL